LSLKYLLGIDFGTSGCKGVITDLNGKVIAEQFAEYEIFKLKPGWYEQDPDEHWWKNVVILIKNLISKSKVCSKDILAIGLTGMYLCTVILDKKGRPIRPAILHYDSRKHEKEKLLRKLGIMRADQLANLLWLKENELKNFKKIDKVLGCHNYIVYKLTGQYAVDYQIANNYGCFDIKGKKWDEELVKDLGISPSVLPPVHPAYCIVGYVLEDVAKITGLKVGTPVIVGSGDTQLSALSCGVIGKGDAMIKYGSITSFMICLDDEISADSLFHCVEPPAKLYWISRQVSERSPRPFGALVKWFLGEFGFFDNIQKSKQKSIYKKLDAEASCIPVGAEGLIILPHFFRSQGIIYGLDIYHNRVHIYRALLESCGYSLRYDLELFKKRAKSAFIMPKIIVAVNGGARSTLWRQIISDILNLPQRYTSNPGSCYGAAYLAGYGIGVFKDFNFMKDKWIKFSRTTYPIPKNTKKYEKFYRHYKKLQSKFYSIL
jgi:xylulokinase